MIVKSLWVFLQSRFNLMKLIKQYQKIIRFGLMTAGLSFLFKFTRYLIQKYEIKISLDMEVFLAAMISSLALYLMDPKD